MPFDDDTKRFARIWTFADQFASGEEALRADFDTALEDIKDGLNDAVIYLEGAIDAIAAENFYLGAKEDFPVENNEGGDLVDGNLILLDGLFYLWTADTWASVGGNHGLTETGLALLAAASESNARGILGLGSTAMLDFDPTGIDGNLTFLDGVQANFGTGSDLIVKHSGTSGFISNGTGTLFVDSTTVTFRDPADALSTSFGIASDTVAGTVLATEAEAEAGTADDKLMTPLAVRQAIDDRLNISGAAAAGATRSWVSINGASGAIRGSLNVASVVREAVGTYLITFTVGPGNNNYCVTTAKLNAGTVEVQSLGIGGVRVISRNAAGALEDTANVFVSCFW